MQDECTAPALAAAMLPMLRARAWIPDWSQNSAACMRRLLAPSDSAAAAVVDRTRTLCGKRVKTNRSVCEPKPSTANADALSFATSHRSRVSSPARRPDRSATANSGERLFGVALLVDCALLVASHAPTDFALALPSIIFGGLLIAGTLKFHYLTTPLLAPDLVYFVNRDLLEVATRYPSIMIALVGGAILVPGLLAARLVARSAAPARSAVTTAAPVLQSSALLRAFALVFVIDSPRGPFDDVFAKGMWQVMNDKNYLVDFFTSFYQTEIRIPPLVEDATRAYWTQNATDNPPTCSGSAAATTMHRPSPQEHPDIVADSRREHVRSAHAESLHDSRMHAPHVRAGRPHARAPDR